jgi:ABC-2 type transport system ATP-binding protein
MTNLFTLRDMSFSYDGTKKVFDNLKLDVGASSTVLLKGRNGTGKSTLLKILSNHIEGDNLLYELSYHGEATTFAKIRQKVAFIPDNALLFEDLTARQNIEFFQLFWRLDVAYFEKVIAICDLFNIKGDLESKVDSFSLGMKNKLFLAINLAYSAELYLLDEPFNALDKDAQMCLVDWVNQDTSAYIIASHLLPQGLEVDFEINLDKDKEIL